MAKISYFGIILALLLAVNTAYGSWTTEFFGSSSSNSLYCKSNAGTSIYDVSGWTTTPLGEVSVVTCTISPADMGANGTLDIQYILSGSTGTNPKTIRFNFGGIPYLTTSLSSTFVDMGHHLIFNRNSLTSQLIKVTPATTTTVTAPILAVNTGNTVTFSISAMTTTEWYEVATVCTGTNNVATCFKPSHGFTTGEYAYFTGAVPTYYNAGGLPVMVTSLGTDTFTYSAVSTTGTSTTPPSYSRYSNIKVDAYNVELKQ